MRLHRLAQIVSIVARSVVRPFPGNRKGRQPTRVEHEVVLFRLLSARPRLSTSHACPSIPPAVGWVSDTPPGEAGLAGDEVSLREGHLGPLTASGRALKLPLARPSLPDYFTPR